MTSDFSPKRCVNHSKRGFSLVEFAIVLGIMGIVLGALWGVVAIVRENVKRSAMSEQMVSIVTNIRSFYMGRSRVTDGAGNRDFVNLTHYLLQQGVLLSEQIRSRAAATWVADHPWGPISASGAAMAAGGLAVTGDNQAGVNVSTRAFRIQLRGLKYSSCVALASKLSGSNPPGLLEVHINTLLTSPVTPDAAAANCAALPADNTLDFLYSLRDQS